MQKSRSLVLIIVVLLMVALPDATLAQQIPPHVFTGIVTIDGVSAPVGTVITAIIDGVNQGSATVQAGGQYQLQVSQGAGTGITFKIGNLDANETATWEQGGATLLNLTANPCSPPASGDWVVGQSCSLVGSKAAAANVIVEENVALTITENASLAIDFSNHHLRIRDGAKVVIRDTGRVSTLSGWFFQNLLGPTEDSRVREAIDLTVDEALISPDFFFFPNGLSLVGAVQTHDLTSAQQLFAEAGFPAGFPGLCIDATGSRDIEKGNAMVVSLAVVGIEATVNGASCFSGSLSVK